MKLLQRCNLLGLAIAISVFTDQPVRTQTPSIQIPKPKPVLKKPEYPVSARRQGKEGTVLVSVVVDASNNVTSARVTHSSGHIALDLAALRSARGLKIKAPPGKPVTVKYNFRLENSSQEQFLQFLLNYKQPPLQQSLPAQNNN